VTLSVVLITYNEEANLARTLESVRALVRDGRGEIVIVDSGSTDCTIEIARSVGAKIFVEEWKGYARQKNSAIDKATGDWILSLDADEELDGQLQQAITEVVENLKRVDSLRGKDDAHPFMIQDARAEVRTLLEGKFETVPDGILIARKNEFLGRWIRYGGFSPDPKLRLFRRSGGHFEERTVHETLTVTGPIATLKQGAILHHCYPTLSDYIEHVNRYSSLGAEMVASAGGGGFSIVNIAIRPWFTFLYNYFFRLGFLDGREGLLLHLYHAVYVSWKYAKAWELGHSNKRSI